MTGSLFTMHNAEMLIKMFNCDDVRRGIVTLRIRDMIVPKLRRCLHWWEFPCDRSRKLFSLPAHKEIFRVSHRTPARLAARFHTFFPLSIEHHLFLPQRKFCDKRHDDYNREKIRFASKLIASFSLIIYDCFKMQSFFFSRKIILISRGDTNFLLSNIRQACHASNKGSISLFSSEVYLLLFNLKSLWCVQQTVPISLEDEEDLQARSIATVTNLNKRSLFYIHFSAFDFIIRLRSDAKIRLNF